MSTRNCEELVTVAYRWDGSPVEVTCGTMYAGANYFCEKCEAALVERYPQGWRYTPGDLCKHGVYVGGCGADYMCGRCETEHDGQDDVEGETTPVDRLPLNDKSPS
jgi:hypothetical protein